MPINDKSSLYGAKFFFSCGNFGPSLFNKWRLFTNLWAFFYSKHLVTLLLAQQQKKIAESETELVNDAVFGSFGNRFEASFDVSSEIFLSQIQPKAASELVSQIVKKVKMKPRMKSDFADCW